MSDSYTTILDDLPAERDALDFQPYIDTLADVVASPKTRTPLTIGIFGSWGAGKTSLMRLVQKQLPKSYRTAWFDAWKYERETDLWRALLLHVLLALQDALPENAADARQELHHLEAALYRAVEREEMGGLQIDWGKLTGGLAQGALQIGLSFIPGASALTKMVEELQKKGAATATEKLVEAIRRERSRLFIEQVRFLEQFQRRFRELVREHIVEKNMRLVVFIDDLDRCLPEKAVEVLEAIKLFLDVPGCVFMLGLDDKVIARGVEIKYRQLMADAEGDGERRQQRLVEGARYLEKIIQLPFQLPPIERGRMRAFIAGLVEEWADEECARVFAAGLADNPRQVKRGVNTYLLLTALAEKTGADILPVQLAKIIALQSALPPLYDFLKDDNHRYLKDLETYFLAQRAGERQRGEPGEGALQAETQKAELPEALTPYLRRRGIAAVRRVLTLHPEQENYNFTPLTPEQLRGYFTLTRRAEAPEIIEAAQESTSPRTDFEPELVRIPPGPFLMGSDPEKDQQARAEEQPQHEVNLYEYWIGKYPVTNRQYQAFIQDSDHRPPPGWDGDRYPAGKADHPVVNVSWHDALAYCRWLGEQLAAISRQRLERSQSGSGRAFWEALASGKYHVTLPSEAEWEKAARGADGRVYPWGDEWDENRGNTEENGPGGTTPVGQYSPQGDSPYGCADMAGNVWEWTRSLWGEEDKPEFTYPYDPQDGRENLEAADSVFRVLRGGSFSSVQDLARCAFRGWNYPPNRNRNLGFRVVVVPVSDL